MGRLLTRMVVGGLFVGHGTQKLFGWFGGQGREGTSATFESAELGPGERNAVAAGIAEAGGGLLLAVGLFTPLAAAALSTVMLTAIRAVHWRNGVWNTKGGIEYPVVMLATLAALADTGPGRLSLDAARGRSRRGTGWALAELAAAGAVSQLVVASGGRTAQSDSQPARSQRGGEEGLRRAA
jgi:putative oxidoreductase